uniref:Uncharacterized protein n=1 Tax=Solanum lycopersicum TaxID=4081 RepID=A0A3Q7HX36_SOLLC
MKNVIKVVFVLSIIMCVLLTPTIARVSASRGSSRTPAVRAAGRASNNSSSTTPLCMSSIAMALFAYLSFVVFVISIIMCVLLTPTLARVSASRGSTRTSTTRLTPVVRAGARADAPSTNNSSSTNPLCMSSIAMALFAYLSFAYF